MKLCTQLLGIVAIVSATSQQNEMSGNGKKLNWQKPAEYAECGSTYAVFGEEFGKTDEAEDMCSQGSAYYDRRMEEMLRLKLEKFRSMMAAGYPALSIPAMDPLNIPPTDMSSIFGGDAFHFQLLHIQIHNLSTFDVTELRADTEHLKVRLAFQAPKVSGRMHYTAAGSLYEVFLLQGSGSCDVAYHDVTVSTLARLKENKGRFQFVGFADSSVDFAYDQVYIQQGQPVPPGDGLGSQVGRILFWTLSKPVAEILPPSLLIFLNDALGRTPIPGTCKAVP